MSTEPSEKLSTLTAAQSALLAQISVTDSTIAPEIQHDGQGNLVEEKPPEPSNAEKNAMLLKMAIKTLSPLLPFLPECYTPEVVQDIGEALADVEEKYGWNVSNFVGVELKLAIAVAPPTIAAYFMGKHYISEMKKQAELDQKGVPALPVTSKSEPLGSN